jgi:prepilin-type N-terminal cleavage/methylation domain-containing protein
MNTLHRRNQSCRSGFTLIEMMIVITIIAILIALLTVAVMGIFGKTAEFQARTEIGQLELALNAAKADLGAGNSIDYLPSKLKLCPLNDWGTTQLDMDSIATLQKLFGRHIDLSTNDGTIRFQWLGPLTTKTQVTLEGHELLVWYLGGMPSVSGSVYTMTGFSTNPSNPTTPLSSNTETRKGPYYEFKSNRLQPSFNGFLQYIDPFSKNYDPDGASKTAIPYAYLSSGKYGNDYNSSGDCPDIPTPKPSPNVLPLPGAPLPYYSGLTGTVPQYVNPKSFQIISAGPDKTFGPGGLWSPSAGVSGAGADDIANFATRKLGATGN